MAKKNDEGQKTAGGKKRYMTVRRPPVPGKPLHEQKKGVTMEKIKAQAKKDIPNYIGVLTVVFAYLLTGGRRMDIVIGIFAVNVIVMAVMKFLLDIGGKKDE